MTVPHLTVVDSPPPDAGIRRDRWGRYLINHPDTGKEQAWTRATTLANTLADRYGLELWSKRNVVLGIGARSDLYAKAASLSVRRDLSEDDKKALNRIVTEAEDAAASSAGANLGTALHRFTERLDAGEEIHVPAPWDKDVAAYHEAMMSHELGVEVGWIERIVLIPELAVAGTCDRLVGTSAWAHPRIGDVKTGKDVVRYGMGEIAAQLAIYAHATHWHDPATGQTHEITEQIDQERALVMHVPVGKGRCTIYEVDIAAGWQAVQLALKVRAWRNRNDLAAQLVPTRLAPPEKIPDDSFEWLHQRVEAIKTEGHGARLAQLWTGHPDIPTFPRGGPTTNDQFWQIAEMCEQVETETGMPFGPPAPSKPKQRTSQ